jgi:hypothetical protein
MLMDNAHPSRKQQRQAPFWFCFVLGLLSSVPIQALFAITLPKSEALRIGKKIWQNECNGTVSGLTSWNAGEDFASLGIGHFIWYPEGKRGPFEESFPKFIIFIRDQSVDMPVWLQHLPASSTGEPVCPWNSRAEFLRDQDSAKMKQLREFLARTVDLQAQFLVDRLQHALPKMLEETAPANRAHIEQQFERVSSSAPGCYALVDYVNFKGEGVLHTERYRGQGWGLLQVLETMPGTSDRADAVREFSRAAKSVLIRRVKNSPAERKESRWLPGWLNRVNSYAANS